MFHKMIFLLGQSKRNPSLSKELNFLKQSEHWSREELEQYQLKKLKKLLQTTAQNSSFYRELWKKYSIDINKINSLEKINMLPTIDKQQLLENKESIQLKQEGETYFYSETSGSSGNPLEFYRSEKWDSRHRAAIFRGYSWYGIHPWEYHAYFWGYNFTKKKKKKIRFQDYLVHRFRIFSYKDEEIDWFYKKAKKAKFIEGYSSMIYNIAKRLKEQGKTLNIKFVKGTSEKIFDEYQSLAKEVYGTKITSEYGAAETGIIAFECPEGNMHCVMENVIVEEIENQVVVTNLLSDSFPIIRYKLGDYIELDHETECPCGREHIIIKNVLGRVGKEIIGIKHSYPTLYAYYIFKNLAFYHNTVLNYQVIQKKKGEVTFMIEQRLSTKQKNVLSNEIEKYFEKDISYEILDHAEFIQEQGKLKDFISYL